MTDTTANLGLPVIAAAQAQKHVTHNEALRALDIMVHGAAIDFAAAPPGPEPENGAIYIVVASGATDEFADHENDVAAWQDGAWAFVTPKEGWRYWVAALGNVHVFTSGAWESLVDLLAATAAEYRSAAAGKVLTADVAFAAADFVALTDAATIAVDLATGINFTVTLGGNRTLGNPTNTKNGQSGTIEIVQDGTGARTLGYGANWEFVGGVAPILSTAAGAVDVLHYQVRSATSIRAWLSPDMK